MINSNEGLSGETKLKTRKRAFIKYLALVFLAALGSGLVSGYLTESYLSGVVGLWLPLLTGFVVLIGLVWFTWDYFKRIDEIDLHDNLWSHLWGFYAGIWAFGGWYFLADLKLVAPPFAGAAILIMLACMFIVYGLRKFGFR